MCPQIMSLLSQHSMTVDSLALHSAMRVSEDTASTDAPFADDSFAHFPQIKMMPLILIHKLCNEYTHQ